MAGTRESNVSQELLQQDMQHQKQLASTELTYARARLE
jgi:hypothetical protein